MLKITVPSGELFNEKTNEFIEIKNDQILALEHSLVSISKWEMKWQIPFLNTNNSLSEEQLLSYIMCMTITPNVPKETYSLLTSKNIIDIKNYMESPMTATTITRLKKNNSKKEIVTSEIIYYWMISLNIPIEFQKWHINRLLTLIEVCNVKNNAHNNKMSKKDSIDYTRKMNQARRKPKK